MKHKPSQTESKYKTLRLNVVMVSNIATLASEHAALGREGPSGDLSCVFIILYNLTNIAKTNLCHETN